ncbi:HU family DNA-binding protein [Anaerovibrio sp.]|uniref:HU family DNA-binding protein n=1 Tax=Anaerovibrio sp. TaxID=1872532 RepID=UPI003F139852
MNKAELVAKVAEKSGITKKDAEKAVAGIFAAVQETLVEGGKVQVLGFGTFEVKERAARTGRNPQTGEELQIAASRNPSFKPGKALKEAVNVKPAKGKKKAKSKK